MIVIQLMMNIMKRKESVSVDYVIEFFSGFYITGCGSFPVFLDRR